MTFIDFFNSWITFLTLIGVGFALLFFTNAKKSSKH